MKSKGGTDNINKIIGTLNKKISKIENAASVGLMKAADLVMQRSLVKCPVTDIEHDHLFESAFIVQENRNNVVFGYASPYAVKVHENPRTGKTQGKSPSGRRYPEGTYSVIGEWKFLETPLKQSVKEVVEIISTEAKNGNDNE